MFSVFSKVNRDMAEDVTTLEHVTVTVSVTIYGRSYALRFTVEDKGYDLLKKLRVTILR